MNVRRCWLLVLAVISGLACLGFFASRIVEIPHRSALRGWDNSFYYFWVRSAITDGDWDFSNEVREANTIASKDRERALNLPETAVGRVPNKYGIGWAVMTAPSYLLANILVRAGNALSLWQLKPDGFNPVYQACVQTAHFLFALVSILFAFLWLRNYFEPSVSALALVSFWVSSPLLYYQSVNLSMAHNMVFLWVSLAYFMTEKLRARNSLPALALTAFSIGMLAITRYQAAVMGLYPLLVILGTLRRDAWSDRLRKASVVAACGLIPIALQMVAWRVVYGQWLVFSYGEEGEGFNWGAPALREVLFDPYHGAIYWHPIIGLAFIGGTWFCWKTRNSVQCAAWFISFLLLWYVHASWWAWPLGASFGYRGFDALWLVLLPGMAFLWQSASRSGACLHAIGAACLLLAVWNINLCLLYCLNAIPRNDPVTYGEVIRASLHTYSSLSELVRGGFQPGPGS